MKHLVFAIFDQKAQAFIPPFTFPTVEMAQRSFAECANDKTHMFSKHPEDFSLSHIGYFDDVIGEIFSLIPTMNLGLAVGYKSRED